MRAIYVMCDGTYRKIGISRHPLHRVKEISFNLGRDVVLKHQFWISEDDIAARVEIMSHALAGSPVLGREWFDITEAECISVISESISRLGATLVLDHIGPGTPLSTKRAKRSYAKRRADMGYKALTFTASVKARDDIKRHAKKYGSQSLALEALIDREYEKRAVIESLLDGD